MWEKFGLEHPHIFPPYFIFPEFSENQTADNELKSRIQNHIYDIIISTSKRTWRCRPSSALSIYHLNVRLKSIKYQLLSEAFFHEDLASNFRIHTFSTMEVIPLAVCCSSLDMRPFITLMVSRQIVLLPSSFMAISLHMIPPRSTL